MEVELCCDVGACNESTEFLTVREQRDLEQLVVYP